MLEENLEIVEKNILEACNKTNRKREEIKLIAVSKTKPISMIDEVYGLGVSDFGENKVQELMEKYPKVSSKINWHMIGHLQTNKVKSIIDKVVLFHSVDSIHLAQVIDKEACKKNLIADILIEVNIAEEDSKFGFKIEEVIPSIQNISKLKHVRIRGLMTIAPFVSDPELNRPIFSKLKQLSIETAKLNIPNVNMNILSMGMTNDYKVAIEEGSTMIRVGTGIFGKRD